jgi:hypothetical protein
MPLIDDPAELAAHYGLPWPKNACRCCGNKIVDGRCVDADQCERERKNGRVCAGLETPRGGD